jgi:hypothetical protein
VGRVIWKGEGDLGRGLWGGGGGGEGVGGGEVGPPCMQKKICSLRP